MNPPKTSNPPALPPVIALAQALVRRPSVTPSDGGCQKLLTAELERAGFTCETFRAEGTDNLLALHGQGSPFFLMLGHTDVVPPGERGQWRLDPFCGDIVEIDGQMCLYGRGSADMKGGDAVMTLALADFAREHPDHPGTVGLLVTSNEEGNAAGGVPYMVEILKRRGLIPDYCLIAECSCEKRFGDEIKNGRRGDLNATIVVPGVQGHVAQPALCVNAAHRAADLICAIRSDPPDRGSEFFPPTSFQVSNIQAGTGADNVVPGSCRIRCNFRFNDLQSRDSIESYLRRKFKELDLDCGLEINFEGDPFLTRGGALIAELKAAVGAELGAFPVLGSGGGTSDGRFIAPLGAQTVEFGPIGATIHQANEHVSIRDLESLLRIYCAVLRKIMLP